MDQKWLKNGSKMAQKWLKNCSKIVQKFFKNAGFIKKIRNFCKTIFKSLELFTSFDLTH